MQWEAHLLWLSQCFAGLMDSNARGQVVEEARLLISVGADANAKDSQGRTAADIAAAIVKLEIVSLLKDVK